VWVGVGGGSVFCVVWVCGVGGCVGCVCVINIVCGVGVWSRQVCWLCVINVCGVGCGLPYQAFPRVSTASDKRWGEKAWV